MSQLLLLTNALQPSTEVLPALGLLSHTLRVAPAEVSALLEAPPVRRPARRRPPRPAARAVAVPGAADDRASTAPCCS